MIRHHRRPFFLFLLGLVLALVSAACGGGNTQAGEQKGPDTQSSQVADELMAQVAGYDTAVGPASRFIVGVFNPMQGPVGYGTVEFAFSFLGEKQASGSPQPGPVVNARYLPLPGSAPAPVGPAIPTFLPKSDRGVYAAEVAFDRPGFWQVQVTAGLPGGQARATSAFQVLPQHEVPAPGDPAIPSENLTLSTAGAPPEAIDSRANSATPVPDPELHQTTVAQALQEKRPVLLVISTPTFCVSQFCGPVTEMVGDLATRYADRARFIHIEVWKNYEAKQLNEAAQQWIAKGPNVNEPWMFLIGADGKVAARWDNVATQEELETVLQQLPVMKP
jgi:hypothetical protein